MAGLMAAIVVPAWPSVKPPPEIDPIQGISKVI
jgi:hypothetical protein